MEEREFSADAAFCILAGGLLGNGASSHLARIRTPCWGGQTRWDALDYGLKLQAPNILPANEPKLC